MGHTIPWMPDKYKMETATNHNPHFRSCSCISIRRQAESSIVSCCNVTTSKSRSEVNIQPINLAQELALDPLQ
jgi:hypothetical protein